MQVFCTWAHKEAAVAAPPCSQPVRAHLVLLLLLSQGGICLSLLIQHYFPTLYQSSMNQSTLSWAESKFSPACFEPWSQVPSTPPVPARWGPSCAGPLGHMLRSGHSSSPLFPSTQTFWIAGCLKTWYYALEREKRWDIFKTGVTSATFSKSAPFPDRSASAARDGVHTKVFSLNNELWNSTESRVTFCKARTPLTWSTVFHTQLTCETLSGCFWLF